MTFEDFKPWHLLAINPVGMAAHCVPFLNADYGAELARRGPAYTVRDPAIVLCGGIAADDQGQGWLWSFVAPAARNHFLPLHRHVRRFLEVHRQPLTASSPEGGPGCRWLELLGFERAEPLAGFFPGCPDQFVYRRV